MQKITTVYKSNANGRGQIVAKGEGKQRTSNYNDALSSAANHGQAAALLGDVLKWRKRDDLSHDSSDAGNKHVFINHDR